MPLPQARLTRRLMLPALLLFTAWQAVACTGASNPTAEDDCRPISHAAGTTCVPNEIERVVTLDSVAFEYAIALG